MERVARQVPTAPREPTLGCLPCQPRRSNQAGWRPARAGLQRRIRAVTVPAGARQCPGCGSLRARSFRNSEMGPRKGPSPSRTRQRGPGSVRGAGKRAGPPARGLLGIVRGVLVAPRVTQARAGAEPGNATPRSERSHRHAQGRTLGRGSLVASLGASGTPGSRGQRVCCWLVGRA